MIRNREESFIVSHQRVSSRYLKLPSRNRKEIEAIIYLQAAKILPYPGQEIIFGYQVVDTDRAGKLKDSN
jgi:Tfp pilus assembly PilM family ATPase